MWVQRKSKERSFWIQSFCFPTRGSKAFWGCGPHSGQTERTESKRKYCCGVERQDVHVYVVYIFHHGPVSSYHREVTERGAKKSYTAAHQRIAFLSYRSILSFACLGLCLSYYKLSFLLSQLYPTKLSHCEIFSTYYWAPTLCSIPQRIWERGRDLISNLMQWLETREKTHVNHKPRGYTGNLPASYVSFIKT